MPVWVAQVIDCDQVARYVWRIYTVDDDGGVNIRQFRGEVHQVSEKEFRASRAIYEQYYTACEPRLEPMVNVAFRCIADAARALT